MMEQKFSSEIKTAAVRKYLNRGNRSVASIAEEFNTSSRNLYNWTKSFGNRAGMKNKAIRPQDRSASDKLNLIISYEKTTDQNRGEFLRQHGIKSEHIEQWRRQIEGTFTSTQGKAQQRSELAAEKLKIKELERELRRKDRALAETTALLVLKKKVALIWGESEE